MFDIQKETLYGDPVCYHSLEETGVTYGAIFASHVLEHVPNWYRFIRECVRVLEPGGRVIFHVPAMSCKRWRGPSKALVPAHGDYYRCFHLEPTLEQVDSLFLPEATGLDIHCDWAGYVGDNSILYIGTRP